MLRVPIGGGASLKSPGTTRAVPTPTRPNEGPPLLKWLKLLIARGWGGLDRVSETVGEMGPLSGSIGETPGLVLTARAGRVQSGRVPSREVSMKNHWVWLDLPAIALLVFLGWWMWPGGVFSLPFGAWTLEHVVGLAFSIALYLIALGLFLLPYAWPALQAWRMERVYRELRERRSG